MDHDEYDDRDERRSWEPSIRVRADERVCLAETGNRRAVREQEGHTLRNAEHGERGDERHDLQLPGKQAADCTGQHRRPEPGHDAQPEGMLVLDDDDGGDGPAQRLQRPDREIDLRRDQYDGQPSGDDADVRRLQEDVEDVLACQEVLRLQAEEQPDQAQREQRSQGSVRAGRTVQPAPEETDDTAAIGCGGCLERLPALVLFACFGRPFSSLVHAVAPPGDRGCSWPQEGEGQPHHTVIWSSHSRSPYFVSTCLTSPA